MKQKQQKTNFASSKENLTGYEHIRLQSQYMKMIVLLIAVTAIVGCDQPYEIHPTRATRELYRDQIDIDDLPIKTRQLYDHLLDKSLTGTKSSDYQGLLDAAQQIIDRPKSITYVFQLCGFPRPYKEVEEEGVPIMIVKVQKSDKIIYMADIFTPEY